MRTNVRWAIGIWAFVLLMMYGVSYAGGDKEEAMKFHIVNSKGISLQDLNVTSQHFVRLPLTGQDFYFGKVLNKKTGQVYGVALDKDGNVVDAEALRANERDAYRAKYGKLEPKLYDQLGTMSDNERVTVGIWLRSEGVAPPKRPEVRTDFGYKGVISSLSADKEKSDAERQRLIKEVAAAIKEQQAEQRETIAAARKAAVSDLASQISAIQQPLLLDLEAKGYPLVYVSSLAPLIYVEVPKSEIGSLAKRLDVDTIYGPNENRDMMNIAKPTQKADVVDGWGFDGTGIKVAILEDSRVEFANPYLNDGVTRVPGDPNVDQHAAACAGMVASQHSTYQGIAQGVDLYSANATSYTDPNLSAAMDWAAITQNVDVINNSWGGNDGTTDLNVHDRHLDYIVRNLWSTVTVAAGNEGGASNRVSSPARGYNVISVGAYDDMNSVTWDGDGMASYSSYVNPGTGIEKPEVAASGSNIMSTTNVSPWTGDVGSGTSYATPMVSGLAAILMERNSALKIRPEAVKAIIMAGALHNIEGASRLSDKDGAGGVDMRAAFRIVDEGWWAWRSVDTNSFPYSYYFYADAGETIRAVISWDSNPSSDYSTDPLQADIDLHLYDPSGTWVAGSSSVPNSYEIMEFTASVSGNYEMRITKWSFSGTTEYVGAAFWVGNRVLAAYSPQTWSTPPAGRHYYRYDAAPYWNAIGIRPPADNDYDLTLYAASAFGDPADHTALAGSYASAGAVDFVVIDCNHAPSGNYYAEVYKFSGSGGNYQIEAASRSTDTAGTYGPYTFATSQVLRVWDSLLSNGVRKYFAVKPTAGDADVGMALYKSDSATSSTWYKRRGSYVVSADSAGAGGAEIMNYQSSEDDWFGLVVWNNGSTTTTTFYLYTDTTAPTGSVSINGGAVATNSTSVTLNLLASDSQTGVYQMRFSNDGSTWSSWEAYGTSKAWTIPSGDGTKTVYVQFKNNAEMVSSNYTDTIILDTVVPTGSIVINVGATYTNTTSVTLTLSATDGGSGVYQMRFANAGYPYSAWEAYSTTKAWTLPSGDGSKQVWVQFSDNAGNTSSYYSDTITLDTVAPTGSIVINAGAAYTNTTSVTLTLSATDATSGVYQMRFSNDGSGWSGWEAYGTTKSWTLTSGDGVKTVYVQYRDNALNSSGNFTDTIILDTVAPTGSIVINAGAAYTNTTSVTLTLSASDAGSGVYQMRFSNDGSSWSGWEAYGTTKAWTLTSGDGTKTVYVQYRDNALNVSSSYTDTIVLDTVAPTGSIVINAGAAYTNTTSVTLTLSATDATSGVYQMRFSNDGSSWSGWEAYGTTKAWTLTSGDGTKTVYVQYRDNALNSSGNFTDTIVLDTVAPTGSIVINGGATYTVSTSVTLTLSASDATSGVYQMRFSNDGSSWSSWEAYGTTKAWTLTSGDGTKTVYVQYRDNALNSSGNFTDMIGLITWTVVPGLTPNTPALAWNPSANKLQMVVRAADNTIWTATFNSAGIFNNDWAPIPGLTPSIPALAWNPVANKMQMVVRALDNTLWTATFNATGTFNNDWALISGLTPSTPALAWNQSANEMLMVVRAADNSLWTATFNSAGVFNNDWASISGFSPSIPTLAWNPSANKMLMVVRASDNTLWTATFNSSNDFNNDWASIPGLTPSTPAIAWDASASEVAMVVRASDDTIWFATFNSSGVFNNNWVSIPGFTPSSPAMAYLPSTGYLEIVVRASDNTLWELLF